MSIFVVHAVYNQKKFQNWFQIFFSLLFSFSKWSLTLTRDPWFNDNILYETCVQIVLIGHFYRRHLPPMLHSAISAIKLSAIVMVLVTPFASHCVFNKHMWCRSRTVPPHDTPRKPLFTLNFNSRWGYVYMRWFFVNVCNV